MSYSIYLHIPFCLKKCPYCDFYSVEIGSSYPQHEKYLLAIIKQLHQSSITNNQSPITVYFGGGTPSLMSPDFFAKLLNEFSKKISLGKNIEITCEVNPGTVDMKWFKDILMAGVNRVSIGVQSFDDQMLSKLGRIHTSGEAQVAIASAQDAGFENVSVDLMSGLPGQSVKAFVEDLKTAMAFQPQHISVYQLTLPTHSPLPRPAPPNGLGGSRRGSNCHDNRLKVGAGFSSYDIPPEDTLVEMLKVTKRILEHGGWQHYEISNYAKKGFESKHNLNYWNYGEYLGLGPSATSMSLRAERSEAWQSRLASDDLFAQRATIKPDIQKYLARNFEYETDNITKRQAMGEFCFLGLRKTDGILLSDFEKLFGVSLMSNFKSQISNFVSSGLLELSSDRLKLTPKGLLLSNQVFAEFV